jgi:flagellar motor switch protein FliG
MNSGKYTDVMAALCEEVRAEVLNRVRNFKHFTPENDPYAGGELKNFARLAASKNECGPAL